MIPLEFMTQIFACSTVSWWWWHGLPVMHLSRSM